jgi:hypothetical protein
MIRIALAAIPLVLCFCARAAEIDCIWLSYKSGSPDKITISWEAQGGGESFIAYGLDADCKERANATSSGTIHRAEIPVTARGNKIFYRVVAGAASSSVKSVLTIPRDTLRVAFIADWQDRKNVDAIVKDQPHLLVAAGDLVDCLHKHSGVGVKDNPAAFAKLIRTYPKLFSSVPFMPALGNHDREIRPRAGKEPPPEAVYDIDATTWRAFFELPGEEWMWHFDIAPFDLRLVALDLQHISDIGTTYQSCHEFKKGSPQFEAYSALMNGAKPALTVTIINERNGSMRAQEKSEWHRLFTKGTAVISGFGYFAERADVDGFSYYNTALSGKGAKYPDPKSAFFASEDSYVLMTVKAGEKKIRVELKKLDDGSVLHAMDEPRE